MENYDTKPKKEKEKEKKKQDTRPTRPISSKQIQN